MSVTQKLVIFLQIVGEGASNRIVQEQFQHSSETISSVFHEVLEVLLIFHKNTIHQLSKNKPLTAQIAKDTKYNSYFKDCLGALHGTHILVHVPATDCALFRNRKGNLSQNILGVCTFNLKFCYVLPGWEGSAHNNRVLEDAIYNHNFKIPPEKYFLADAGYHNTDYVLCLYCGVQYHLKEQAASGLKPKKKEELFNLRHSSLQNAIERIFGVMKRRFKIFERPLKYTIQTRIDLVFAVTALHNFITANSISTNI